jgi:hypothetical protein
VRRIFVPACRSRFRPQGDHDLFWAVRPLNSSIV